MTFDYLTPRHTFLGHLRHKAFSSAAAASVNYVRCQVQSDGDGHH